MALKHKSEIAQRFSKAAWRYDSLAKVQAKLANIAVKKSLLATERTAGNTLDIGCATGVHSMALKGRVIGLDLAHGMLQQAKTCDAAKATWVNGDMDALPFVGEHFQHVFSSMALQWSDSPDHVLAEIYRVLAPAGNATLLIPIAGSFNQLKSAYQGAGLPVRLHELASAACWQKAAAKTGFAIRSIELVTEVDQFDNLLALLSSISKIGASSAKASTAHSLTRTNLAALSAHYPVTETGQFAIDYHCVLLELEK